MGEWDRRTPWRQGHVLTADTVAALRLAPEANLDSLVAVVVSHDCDLAQGPSIEPAVEVIVGQRIAAANGNFTHGKNPRRLHIPAAEAGVAFWVELTATARQSIPKQGLAAHVPSATILINSASRNTLQCWLAARYRRSAFPDAFDKHLADTRIAERIARVLEPLGNHIIAVFFDVDEGVDRDTKNAEEPFTLSIDLLYSTENEPVAAEAAARKAAEAITSVFHERCFDTKTNKWHAIELLGCAAISDEILTYSMSLRLKRWNADYISLRAEPPQPMIAE
jgi:hypothetical protein